MIDQETKTLEEQESMLTFSGANIPVPLAASIMGKDPMFIRIGLQRGLLPFGVAYKKRDRNQQYDYYISPKLFYEFTGVIVPEDEIEIAAEKEAAKTKHSKYNVELD